MPQVPILDGQTVQTQALQPVYQQNLDVSSGTEKAGQALSKVGDVLQNYELTQARTAAWDADAKLKRDFGAWQADTQPKMQGASAAGGVVDPTTGKALPGYGDQADQWFEAKKAELIQGLNPLQQKWIGRSLEMYRAAQVNEARHWQMGQVQQGEQTAFTAAKSATVDAAVKSGNPDAVPGAVATIQQQNAQWAQSHGMVGKDGTPDANWLHVQNEQDLTGLHSSIVENLQRTDPQKASAYLSQWQDQIKPEVFSRLQQGVKTADSSMTGLQGANESWSKFIPKDADPSLGATAIPIDKMIDDVQDKFKGDPVAMKAAVAQVTEKYRVWNEAQQSAQRSYKATLLGAFNGGGTLATMQAMPEWQKLDGDTREKIEEHLQNQSDRHLMRQVSLANLQDRQYAIKDRSKGQSSMGDYIDLVNNPEKLASLAPQDVQALRLTMSDQQVEHIAAARQKLNSAADVKNARLDTDTFNMVAGQFGVKTPKDPGFQKTGTDAQVYATLRQNIDASLQQEQADKKRPLTRDEKQGVIQQELARQVTVNPGMFSFNKTAPLATVPADQRQNIVDAAVPTTDRQQIIDSFQRRQGRKPSDDEIKGVYLTRVRGAAK